jgi:hypothetical protein
MEYVYTYINIHTCIDTFIHTYLHVYINTFSRWWRQEAPLKHYCYISTTLYDVTSHTTGICIVIAVGTEVSCHFLKVTSFL